MNNHNESRCSMKELIYNGIDKVMDIDFNEVLKDYIIQGKTVHTLKEILECYNVSYLKNVAKDMDLAGYTRLKKSELIELISKEYIFGYYFENIEIILNYDSFMLFNRCVSSSDDLVLDDTTKGQAYQIVMSGVGIIFINGEDITLVIPDEIKAFYKNILTDKFIAAKKELYLLNDYINACVNLYGVIHMDDFIKLYFDFTGVNITKEYLILAVDASAKYHNKYMVYKEEYFASSLCEYLVKDKDKPLDRFIKITSEIEKYIPNKEEILIYKDIFSCDSTFSEINKMYSILLELSNNNNDAYYYVIEFLNSINMGFDINLATDRFDEIIATKSRAKVDRLLEATESVIKNTRLGINGGFTSQELFLTKTKQVQGKKVGRNEPCPCGSGKKYKKCCME